MFFSFWSLTRLSLYFNRMGIHHFHWRPFWITSYCSYVLDELCLCGHGWYISPENLLSCQLLYSQPPIIKSMIIYESHLVVSNEYLVEKSCLWLDGRGIVCICEKQPPISSKLTCSERLVTCLLSSALFWRPSKCLYMSNAKFSFQWFWNDMNCESLPFADDMVFQIKF